MKVILKNIFAVIIAFAFSQKISANAIQSRIDVQSSSSSFQFLWNNNLMIAKGFKISSSPSAADDLAITYSERNGHFKFSTINLEKEKWYRTKIGSLEKGSSENITESQIVKVPSKTPKSVWTYLPLAIMTIFIIFPLVAVIFLIYILFKISEKKIKK